MAIIDNIKDTISKTGKSAVKKTKDLAGIAKITADIEDTKNLLNDVYKDIGKKYCELYDRDSASKEFEIDIATVNNLKERLEELQAQRLSLRGKVKCPECGKSSDSDYSFCPHCGKRLPEHTAEEVDFEDNDIEVEIIDTKDSIPDEDEEIDD